MVSQPVQRLRAAKSLTLREEKDAKMQENHRVIDMSIESIIDYAKKTVDDDDCFTVSQIASLHNMLDLISDAIILTDTNKENQLT